MTDAPHQPELALTMAALRLRVSYYTARTLMLRGELRGRLRGTRWFVAAEDVARLAAVREADSSAMSQAAP